MNYMDNIDAWLTEEAQNLLDNWPSREGQADIDEFKRNIKNKM